MQSNPTAPPDPDERDILRAVRSRGNVKSLFLPTQVETSKARDASTEGDLNL